MSYSGKDAPATKRDVERLRVEVTHLKKVVEALLQEFRDVDNDEIRVRSCKQQRISKSTSSGEGLIATGGASPYHVT